MISSPATRCDSLSTVSFRLSAMPRTEGTTLSAEPLIAVIDDDLSLRTALVGLVRSLGYDARGFGSAEEFLQAGEPRAFACIISDIQMPGMSGIELKRHLAAKGCPAPVIMITARSERELEDSARAAGAFCFLKKPFEPGALIQCLEKALELGAKSQ
jgi:FixJ family two-component response regulator